MVATRQRDATGDVHWFATTRRLRASRLYTARARCRVLPRYNLACLYSLPAAAAVNYRTAAHIASGAVLLRRAAPSYPHTVRSLTLWLYDAIMPSACVATRSAMSSYYSPLASTPQHELQRGARATSCYRLYLLWRAEQHSMDNLSPPSAVTTYATCQRLLFHLAHCQLHTPYIPACTHPLHYHTHHTHTHTAASTAYAYGTCAMAGAGHCGWPFTWHGLEQCCMASQALIFC